MSERVLGPVNRHDVPISTDPLGEALHLLRMNGVLYSQPNLSAPWGVRLPELPGHLMFHVVMSGRCWLEVEGVAPQLLQPGDFALAPHGEGHVLLSEPGASAKHLHEVSRRMLSDRYEIIEHGGGGAETHMMCGVVRFGHPAAHELVKLLPKLIYLEAWRTPYPDWLQSALGLMAAEAREPKPGGETIITRLADILVVQTLRAWIVEDPAAQAGWLGALRDRRVGQAILLMQRDPARAWTIASLANRVNMSRSAFAARFRSLTGEPPMAYLTRWRMNIAYTRLKEERISVGKLADELGYQSEAAFCRAFKRQVGVAPGAVRRQFMSYPV